MKILGLILAVLVSFGSGYITAGLSFVYSDTYELKEAIPIVANGKGHGVLPKGSRLHYQSSAHNEVDFYVFVTVPFETSKIKTKKVEVDAYKGIKRLRGDFE